MQCTGKMMVINDVMPVLWAKDYWDQMFAKKLFALLFAFITPALALGFDLTHPDCHLRWTEVYYGDRSQKRFTDSGHVRLLPRERANFEKAMGDSECSLWFAPEMLIFLSFRHKAPHRI